MNVILTPRAEKDLAALSSDIVALFLSQQSLFRQDLRDPRLHTKKLVSLPAVFSFRITREYRALFRFVNASTAVIFAIGHLKDIYRNM
jgi:mRNA-degrading endonuclease RelE of RelBE toxin-antitoxin system